MSEESKSRGKLSSGHSEPGADNANTSNGGTGKNNSREAATRSSSGGSPRIEALEKTRTGDNIKSFFATHIPFTKKEVARPKSLVDRVASDEGIEDEAQEKTNSGKLFLHY